MGGQNVYTRKMEGLFYNFDVINQKWKKLQKMNFGRSGPGTFFKNDFLYVFGGFRHNNIERYNIKNIHMDQ